MTETTSDRGPGRPTKYNGEETDELAFKLALNGLTDESIADVMGISASTLYLWKHEHPSFSEALWKGKTPANAEVAHSLYQRAVGFEIEQEVVRKGKDGQPVVVKLKTHIPGDPSAAMHFLTNRERSLWKNRQDVEVSEAPDRDAEAAAARDQLRKVMQRTGLVVDAEDEQ